jgi:lipoate-protein ligase A
MQFIDISFDTPEENLACDDALLDLCENGDDGEVLRFWDSATPFVVVGHANKTAAEVHTDACRRDDVPVLRRISGGGAVLQGPGCLNFSLILKIPSSGPLLSITGANRFITEEHARVLRQTLGESVRAQGLSDVALGTMKFSGNAQRRRRRSLLFHGTFLLSFDIPRVERSLAMPSRQPEYRQNRAHSDFLTNAISTAAQIKDTLKKLWRVERQLSHLPLDRIRALVRNRYASPEWNFRF